MKAFATMLINFQKQRKLQYEIAKKALLARNSGRITPYNYQIVETEYATADGTISIRLELYKKIDESTVMLRPILEHRIEDGIKTSD